MKASIKWPCNGRVFAGLLTSSDNYRAGEWIEKLQLVLRYPLNNVSRHCPMKCVHDLYPKPRANGQQPLAVHLHNGDCMGSWSINNNSVCLVCTSLPLSTFLVDRLKPLGFLKYRYMECFGPFMDWLLHLSLPKAVDCVIRLLCPKGLFSSDLIIFYLGEALDDYRRWVFLTCSFQGWGLFASKTFEIFTFSLQHRHRKTGWLH